ncbi:MAG: nitroreductase family protein [Candidatus Krumholzibacteria bacterium]|nr:nitroreductase family protein [Candidatus Krumholzibacteria bacterium]MDH4336010.1 nitroreductase family protein [Candidatus Krumholzibacteria bacterium]MDH5268414.1 nitroreductase family protein [Candidatus Krumholzibacteria bacterium]
MSHHPPGHGPAFKSVPLDFVRRDDAEMAARAREFLTEARSRRSVRHFAPDPVPRDALLDCIDAAAQAPSGANKQPWTFVLVTDPELKRRIRAAAEEEERAHYGGRASERWLADLEPLGTDENKPFLEIAPALIVVFAQRHGPTAADLHYYVNESVGIATGILIAALHHAGFATLTHTPSPMKFLGEILGRPANERAYLLIPVGLPAAGCRVPGITRKGRGEYLVEV